MYKHIYVYIYNIQQCVRVVIEINSCKTLRCCCETRLLELLGSIRNLQSEFKDHYSKLLYCWYLSWPLLQCYKGFICEPIYRMDRVLKEKKQKLNYNYFQEYHNWQFHIFKSIIVTTCVASGSVTSH